MQELGLDPAKKRLLFFSRGRGSGHAVPDMEIAKFLAELRPDVEVVFASYATGAETLVRHGFRVIDLGLPEVASLLDVIVLAGKLIGGLQPHLVVTHEEFGALPAARIFDREAIFVNDWFLDERDLTMRTLRYARKIVFTEQPGFFPEPSEARGRITYVGPILRRFRYSTRDRAKARAELELKADAAVVVVLPGTYATEARIPIADLVIEAFAALDATPKQLVWLAGPDAESLGRRWDERDDVRVLESEWPIDRLMAASNVAVTKANRMSVVELESLGIRSVALSPALNPIDDIRTKAAAGVRYRLLAEATPEEVARDLRESLREGDLPPPTPPEIPAAELAARLIAEAIPGRDD